MKSSRRRGRSRFTPLVLGGLAVVVAAMLPLRAVRAQSEDQVKAAFLFNFARYVEWPDSAFAKDDSPLRICTLAGSGFASVVSEVVSGKQVADRPVEVRAASDLAGAAGCHILYIDSGRGISARDVVARLSDASVFTIADDEGFAAAGGVANFFNADNKVRFEINPDAAKRAGLKISSRLLRLARVVE